MQSFPTFLPTLPSKKADKSYVFNVDQEIGTEVVPNKLGITTLPRKLYNCNNTGFCIYGSDCFLPLLPPCQDSQQVVCQTDLKYKPFLLKDSTKKIPHQFYIYKNMSLKKFKSKSSELHKILEHLNSGNTDAIVDIPQEIISLVQTLPVDWREKHSFLDVDATSPMLSGSGCLSCYSDQENKVLMHTSGPNLNKLKFTDLSFIDNKIDTKSIICDAKSENTFKEKIVQIETQNINNQVYCGIRGRKSMWLGKLLSRHSRSTRSKLENEKFKVIASSEDLILKDELTHFALSPHLAECLYVTSAGTIRLYHFGEHLSQNAHTCKYTFKSLKSKWWNVQFGSHPRCFVCAYNTGLLTHDVRDSSKKTTFLIKNNVNIFSNDEIITAFVKSQNIYHYYVGSSHSLTLIDERFPDHPILQWEHMLRKSPNLSNTLVLDGKEIVLLGSGESQDIACFSCQSNGTTALSLTQPLHLSSPSSMVNHLLHEGNVIDPRVRIRLQFPLQGIVTTETDRNSFVCISQTNTGDVFYQELKLKDTSGEESSNLQYDHGCSWKGISAENLSYALDYCNKVTDIINKNDYSLAEKINKQKKSIDLTTQFKLMCEEKPHSNFCPLCCKCEDAALDYSFDDSNVCSSCGIYLWNSKDICIKKALNGIITGTCRTSTNFKLPPVVDPHKFSDRLTKNMYNVWNSENPLTDDEAESTTSFSRSSRNLPGLSNSNTQDENISGGFIDLLSEPKSPLQKRLKTVTTSSDIEIPSSQVSISEDTNNASIQKDLLKSLQESQGFSYAFSEGAWTFPNEENVIIDTQNYMQNFDVVSSFRNPSRQQTSSKSSPKTRGVKRSFVSGF